MHSSSCRCILSVKLNAWWTSWYQYLEHYRKWRLQLQRNLHLIRRLSLWKGCSRTPSAYHPRTFQCMNNGQPSCHNLWQEDPIRMIERPSLCSCFSCMVSLIHSQRLFLQFHYMQRVGEGNLLCRRSPYLRCHSGNITLWCIHSSFPWRIENLWRLHTSYQRIWLCRGRTSLKRLGMVQNQFWLRRVQGERQRGISFVSKIECKFKIIVFNMSDPFKLLL